MKDDTVIRDSDPAVVDGYENKAFSGSESDVSGQTIDGAASRDRQVTGRMETAEAEGGDDWMRCGLGSCKPDCLQVFNNPKAVLVWLCLFSFAQGFLVNGVNNVNTSTLERRFELSSSQAGIISSSYDISAAILSMPISYYGAHAHQPRMLSLAALVMACGAFVMSVPHFATGLYDLKESQSDECILGTNSTLLCDVPGSGSGSNLNLWLGVFIVGMILNGIGGTTLYSVGIVFLDNSVSPKVFPLYQGFLYSTSTLGPAVGYLLGGYFVQSLYVDVDKVDPDSIDLTEDDPRFVGAWWLGFLASGVFLVMVMLPLMCYPKELPASKKARMNRKSEAHETSTNSVASQEGFGTRWRDLPMSLKILLTNPVYICLNLSGSSEALIVSGIATFLPKFIQNQFTVSAGYAAMLAGAVSVPGAAGGQFVGGLVCKVAKLKVRGMLRNNICVSLLAMVLCFVFFCRCSVPSFAGINTDYENVTKSLEDVNLQSECNSHCGCTTLSYEPICGINNVQYFSPCHAGCQKAEINGSKMLVNCSCIDTEYTKKATTTDGVCDVDCTLMYVFLPFMFLTIFMVFMAAVPSLSATMRCIPESQRSFGIGVQWVFLRLLGSIPGPILMGAVFDSTCEVWQERCDGRGSCWVYNTESLSTRILILAIVVKVVSTFFFVLAYVLYRAPPGDSQPGGASTRPEARSPTEDGMTENTADGKNVFVNYGADLSPDGVNGRASADSVTKL